jgi:hypothetical protein
VAVVGRAGQRLAAAAMRARAPGPIAEKRMGASGRRQGAWFQFCPWPTRVIEVAR